MQLVDESKFKYRNTHLELLSPQHHDKLILAAADKNIWINHPQKFHKPNIFKQSWLQKALDKPQRHTFVILLNNEIIGSSSYYDIDADNQRLKIGYTWYQTKFWGKGHNSIVKYLMLKYAFEEMHYRRVAFDVDSINERSQGALKKLGAQYEGTLRNHIIRADNTQRHTAVFSIIKEDWPKIKSLLEKKIENLHEASH